MDLLLFTYPNCQKCEDLKAYLRETGLAAATFKVEEKEGRLKIREFLPAVKRDATGAIILPTLVVREEGAVAAVVNNRQELEAWLHSKA